MQKQKVTLTLKLVFFFTFIVLAVPNQSYAYWEGFGFKLPTSGSEIYELLFKSSLVKMVDTVEERSGFELSDINDDSGSGDSEDLDSTESVDISDITVGDTPDFNFSESFINDLLEEHASGYSITQRYTVSNAQIDLLDNSFIAIVTLENGAVLNGEFELTNGGTNIKMVKLENSGEKSLSKIELGLISKLSDSIFSKALSYFPEYADRFEKITINDDQLGIWLNKND